MGYPSAVLVEQAASGLWWKCGSDDGQNSPDGGTRSFPCVRWSIVISACLLASI